MFKLSKIFVRHAKNIGTISCASRVNVSSAPIFAESKAQSSFEQEDTKVTGGLSKAAASSKPQSNMVAAAFASLHSEHSENDIKTPFTDEKIAKAKTIDEILSISDGNGVSRKHALKVVSILADWSTSGTVKLADFESDPRFIRLCRVLTKNQTGKGVRNSLASRSEDLSTILSVTADDEAAKLVSSITLPQMVKVMTTLTQKKRRSTLLLRALAYNITGSSDKLNLKQCADLLYSMSNLNFPDENLFNKISSDICHELENDIKKSAVIGSALTSIGLLKFKNSVLLDAFSEWILKNHSITRPQDIFSFFMTLAVLNYLPSNADKVFEVLIPQMTLSEAGRPLVWLEIVWSLVLLNQATEAHISSVLSDNFIQNLEESKSLSSSAKLKLLNINGAAVNLLHNYKGPVLSKTSSVVETKLSRTREKTEVVNSLVDSLKNLIQAETNLRSDVDTGMGFFIDAECLLNKKCDSLPLDQSKTEGATRVAIISYDYHDMTRGRIEPIGITVLASKLLEAQGYKVLTVPYTEFKPRDKLVNRVKYLETKLKEIVNS